MGAQLVVRRHKKVDDTTFYEVVIWHLPRPVLGCTHYYKYRLALVQDDKCILRYDNERGKGDHRHIGSREEAFEFTSLKALFSAFRADMKRMLK
ncbi:toxin-antitoxin system TumE family protein [Brucella sp. IR073]|uniref:toxin-antitoxin system TumE family protein n=1 Tax=unclassified Brucella TaxID=2632610 RepID=UPI003B986B6D